MRFRSASIALIFLATAATAAAHADTVTFALLNATQTTTTSGSTLFFNASVSAPSTNTGSEFLNGDSYHVNGANGFGLDDSAFFNNYPLSLAPGQSFSGLLFTLLVPSGSLANTYTGSFSLLGGATENTYSTLGTRAFTVNVTPAVAVTPEPSSLLMLGTGVLAMATTFRRRFTGLSR